MNYIGSKLSLLPFLDQCISSVLGIQSWEGVSFCDLFAGTGAVGRYFKHKGCRVIANDLQYYSYVLNRHYIGNSRALTFEGLEAELEGLREQPQDMRFAFVCSYLDSIEGVKGFVYHEYSQGDKLLGAECRLYYSRENAMRCDAIRQRIEAWMSSGKITQDEYFALLASLLEAIDKVANTASVYGAFLKQIKRSAQMPLKLIPLELVESSSVQEVYNQEAERLIQRVEPTILYLDPPYNQRQYAANYHVLETIARYDNPSLSGKTGMRDYSEQRSRFCSKRTVLQAFEQLILETKAQNVFLSYNNEGLMSHQEIRDIMASRGRYTCFQKDYSRFQADTPSERRRVKAHSTIEYLHCLEVGG